MSSLLTLGPPETTNDMYNVLVGSPHFIEFCEVGDGGLDLGGAMIQKVNAWMRPTNQELMICVVNQKR